ncbi:tyrosine-protein kinase Fer-like [Saccostrea cucullata]|uniref:tyrosine-protein kinase Fer-like n=1 Tax=Saccostrea cuccullata TaxID=36930 RepID=UPI002ED0A4C6
MASSLHFAQDIIRCSLCVNEVDYYCKTCNVKLCSECTSQHLFDKGKVHEVVGFNGEKESLKGPECPSHTSNNCEIFCRNCEIPICTKCVVGIHKQHDFTDLDDFLEEKRQSILEDIKEIETLLLPKLQKHKDIIHEERNKSTTEVISAQENVICKAVKDFGNTLKEKVKQHTTKIEEEDNENVSAEQNIIKTLRETKSLLSSNDSKAILEYSGIKPELRKFPKPLNNFMPILDVKKIQEEEIASLFGTLIVKDVTKEKEKENVVNEVNFERESWFHGYIPRKEAERLLKKDGDFLVRVLDSTPEEERSLIISAYREKPVHTKILSADILKSVGPSGTMVDWINYLMKTGEHYSTDRAVLVNPIPREKNHLAYDKIKLGSKILKDSPPFPCLFIGTYDSKTVFLQNFHDNGSAVFQSLKFLRQFNHPNIVNFIGFSAMQKPFLLVIEYLSGGSLLLYLREKGEFMTARKRTEMCLGVAKGMAYVHGNKCIHRDLAARNCLVSEDSTVKIYNFWMSKEGEEFPSDIEVVYAKKWTSPETILSEKFTAFNDVWSFGILMWEIFSSGKIPYGDMNKYEAIGKVAEGYRLSPPAGTPKACYDVMLKCWDKEPTSRYHFDTLVEKLNKIIRKLK